MMFSYFLLDSVERQRLIEANNDLVKISDELWVFGQITEGVKQEIKLAKSSGLLIKHFSITPLGKIDSEIFFEEIDELELGQI
ncbi:MAG: hypothetical protein AB1721_01595 [Patescibacteria group bacterium]